MTANYSLMHKKSFNRNGSSSSRFTFLNMKISKTITSILNYTWNFEVDGRGRLWRGWKGVQNFTFHIFQCCIRARWQTDCESERDGAKIIKFQMHVLYHVIYDAIFFPHGCVARFFMCWAFLSTAEHGNTYANMYQKIFIQNSKEEKLKSGKIMCFATNILSLKLY